VGWLAIGIAMQILADCIVGLRLLALAARTRRLPELCLGACTFLFGGVGLPLSILARSGRMADPETAALLLAGGFAAQDLACLFLAVGTWRIFRPDPVWFAAPATFGVLAVASLVGEAFQTGYAGGDDGGAWYWVGFFPRAATFAWAGAESLRYHGLLQRRMALGLTDAVLADRFRMWAVCCGGVVLGFAVFWGARVLGIHPARSAVVLALSSAVGIVSAVSLWLAFLPPAAYVARLRRRTLAASAAATSR